MSLHRYPFDRQRADLVRGGAGLVLTGLPLALLDLHWGVALIFALAAALFASFVARTAQRHFTVYESGDQGIVVNGPLGGAIAWTQLSALKLHFYSTRRDRGGGWMNLTLKGGGKTLKLESTLGGFDAIVDRAAEAAKTNKLMLNETTMNNLAAMGAVVPTADADVAQTDDAGSPVGEEQPGGGLR